MSQIIRWLDKGCAWLERRINAEPHWTLRFLFSVDLLALYIIRGFFHVVLALLFPSSVSFTHFYEVKPKHGYKVSYLAHQNWWQRARVVSMGALATVCIVTTVINILFLTAQPVYAVTRTWDGGGADELWSNCLNWSSDTCPGTLDVATFDATSTKNVTIASSLSGSTAPAGIDINTGYTGIITQNSGVTISIGASNFDQAAGTFTGGDSTISTSGAFILSGGTFNSTSGNLSITTNFTHTAGGTFNHSNGTVTFIGSSSTVDVNSTETFYNLVVNLTNSWTKTVANSDTLTVANTLTLTEGSLNQTTIPAAGTVVVQGSLSHDANFDGGTAQVNLEGSATASLAGGAMTGFKLNSASAVATGPSSGTVTFENHLDITNGTFNAGAGAITLSGSKNFTQSGGVFNGGAGGVTFPNTVGISGGTFNAGTSTTFSCDSCTFTLSAGALVMGSGTLNVATNWTQTSGTFTEGTGLVNFNGGNGSKTIDVNTAETFYNLTFNATVGWQKAIADNDTLTVSNTLTLTEGDLNQTTVPAAGGIIVLGTLTHASTFDGGTTQINLEGSATATLSSGGMTGLKLNSASAVATAPSSGTLTFENHLTIADGTFNAGGGAIVLAAAKNFIQSGGVYNGGAGAVTFPNTVTISAGTFNAGTSTSFSCNSCTFTLSGGALVMGSGTLNVATHWTQTLGTFTEGTSLVSFYAGNGAKTIDVDVSETFYNLNIGDAATAGWQKVVANNDTLNVSNDLTLTDGILNQTTIPSTGSVSVSRHVTAASAFDGGTAKLVFTGGLIQNFTLGAAGVFNGDIAVNKTSGEVDLLSALTMDANNQDLVIQEGTFDLSGSALSVTAGATETIVVETGGNLQLQGSETITADSASYPQLDSGSRVSYDGAAGPYTIKDYTYHHLDINGVATFSMGANEVLGGNLSVKAGTFDVNDLTLGITGNTLVNGGTIKSGTNVVTFGDAAGDTVTISAGTFEIESDVPGTDIVKNAGTWTNSGGTIKYNAATGITGVIIAGLEPYFNLTVDSAGSTYSLTEATDVNGSVTLTNGTVDVTASNFGIVVGGSWTRTAGILTIRSGTVTFNNSANTTTFTGDTTFYNLTSTTAAKNFIFTAGSTQTTKGTLTLTGSSGNLIVLRSSSDGVYWNLKSEGTSNVSYVDVKDSDASSGNAINPGLNSTNSGHNLNWTFGNAPSAPTTLYSNNTTDTAQSGLSNPGNLTDATPNFSAIYNDADSGDIANKYCIQVNTASDFTGTNLWYSDSASCGTGTTITNITAGNRSTDIEYAGSALTCGTTYYWRIKFWDDDNSVGSYSSAANLQVNCTPSVAADSGSVNEDVVYTGDLSHTDGDSDAVTYSVVSTTGSGTTNITNTATGAFTYTPNGNFNGSDSFTYRVNDGTVNSNTATFSLTIIAINDAPNANAGADQNVNEDSGTTTLSAAASSDADGNTLTYTWLEVTDSGDGCSLGSTTISQPTVTLANRESNYACSFSLTVSDGIVSSASDTVIVNITSNNDAPALPDLADQGINEGSTLSVAVTASDSDSQTVALSAADLDGALEGAGVEVTDVFTDNGNKTGTLAWTPSYTSAGTYHVAIAATDNTTSVSETMTIEVANVNRSPSFSGALPNLAVTAGNPTTAIFDLDDYFSDPDNETLSYTVSGNEDTAVTITAGEVFLDVPSSADDSMVLTFTATDGSNSTATSNSMVVTVTHVSIDPSLIDHLNGTGTGAGVVTVYDEDGEILAQWTAFETGGVIPRLLTSADATYVFTVKRTSGTTMHVYTTAGALVRKKRISPKLHWRRLATGNVYRGSNREEVVIATKRGRTVYIKVFTYNGETQTFKLEERARVFDVIGEFRVTVRDEEVHIKDIRDAEDITVENWY